jgi:hypothetical protein
VTPHERHPGGMRQQRHLGGMMGVTRCAID